MRSQFRLNLLVDARREAIRIGLKRLIQIVVVSTGHNFTDRIASFPPEEITERGHCRVEMEIVLAPNEDIEFTAQFRAEPGPILFQDGVDVVLLPGPQRFPVEFARRAVEESQRLAIRPLRTPDPFKGSELPANFAFHFFLPGEFFDAQYFLVAVARQVARLALTRAISVVG